jgi:hypothetical protein
MDIRVFSFNNSAAQRLRACQFTKMALNSQALGVVSPSTTNTAGRKIQTIFTSQDHVRTMVATICHTVSWSHKKFFRTNLALYFRINKKEFLGCLLTTSRSSKTVSQNSRFEALCRRTSMRCSYNLAVSSTLLLAIFVVRGKIVVHLYSV